MEKVEFRVTADGRVMYRIAGKEEKRLTKFTKDIVEPMTALIHDRFPECYARLATIYRKNVTKMVDRFVRCNFGEEDLLSDDVEHDLLHFEEVRCPLRGICEDERVICKPKTLVNLSNGERTVTKLYLNGYSLDDIAEQLGKSKSTIKTQLLRAKKKLGVKSCRDIIRVVRTKGVVL
jgi:DNA-binding CsgD family transcriptional regulator